jgi:Zn-dependent protease with chaperone function
MTRSAQPAPTLLVAAYGRLGARMGASLYQEASSGKLDHGFHLARVAAVGVATAVHLMTVAVALAGVWFLSLGITAFTVPFAVIMFWLAFELRPRLEKRPPDLIEPSAFPHLFRFVRDVASRTGTDDMSGVEVTGEFNAAVRRVGLRRRTYLEIGLPLIAVLRPQERVALLAHEFGHLVTGDPLRGEWIATAVNTLSAWYDVFRPRPGIRPYPTFASGFSSIAQLFAAMFSAVLRGIALTIGTLLVHLTYRDSQRAEYRADLLASEIAGSEATATMLETLASHDAYVGAVTSAGIRNLSGLDLFTQLDEDMQAKRAVFRLETLPEERSTLDSTHPPVGSRIQLARRATSPARLVLSNGESRAIDDELSGLRPAVGDSLVRLYRAIHYDA